MYGSVGRRCGRPEVYARPPCSPRRSEGGTYVSQMENLHAHTPSSTQANILINGDRRACIADFGLSTITGVATQAANAAASKASLISTDTLMSFTGGGTRRWMSPELLDPERFGMLESEGNRPSRQSDCYALGMVIYEVGSRKNIYRCEGLTGNTIGAVWTPPLPRTPVGYLGRSRNIGRRSTEETGGG